MATQKQINDLLNDNWGLEQSQINQSLSRQNQIPKSKLNYEESNNYGSQQFEDYQQSKRTQNFQSSQSQSLPNKNKQKQKTLAEQKLKYQQKQAKLTEIKQEKQGRKTLQKKYEGNSQNKGNKLTPNSQNYIKPALQLKTQSAFNKQKSAISNLHQDKLYLAHNYARLQQRERQLLFTSLTEENKKLKEQLAEKNANLNKAQTKYKILLSQKTTPQQPTPKQLTLEKKVAVLTTKLQQMSNLHKIAEDRQRYKTGIPKNVNSFIPEEEANRREEELLQLIEKLKQRLLQSDQNMGVLQKKLSQGAEHNDEILKKMKRVEQLEYRIQKMVEQTETDKGYIEILKEKVKDLQRLLQEEKKKVKKQQLQLKQMQMGSYTHADLVKQLKQTVKQKQLLQKSLKEMSAAMMSNVRKNYKSNIQNNIEDSQQLLQPNRN